MGDATVKEVNFRRHSKLGGYDSRGRIHLNPKVPQTWKGITVKARLRRHETTERDLRKKGLTLKKAHREALKKEHKDLPPHQIQQYEGLLGSIARWHPMRRRNHG